MEYGLIGEKLEHSYSKPIHGMLADYTYELCPLSRTEFPLFMEKKDFKAINVTIPYKKDVMPYLYELHESARLVGAVNTILNKDGKLYGYNTDYHGLLYTFSQNDIIISGRKVLVLGNGGAAKAVLAVLKQQDAKQIIIIKHKIEAGVISYEEAAACHADAEIIINTSPVGMYPNTGVSPVDLTPYKKLEAVIDLIYNPLKTALLVQAEARRVKAVNGLAMLVAQAKYAAEYFLDVKIEDAVIPEILEKMIRKIAAEM